MNIYEEIYSIFNEAVADIVKEIGTHNNTDIIYVEYKVNHGSNDVLVRAERTRCNICISIDAFSASIHYVIYDNPIRKTLAEGAIGVNELSRIEEAYIDDYKHFVKQKICELVYYGVTKGIYPKESNKYVWNIQ